MGQLILVLRALIMLIGSSIDLIRAIWDVDARREIRNAGNGRLLLRIVALAIACLLILAMVRMALALL